MSRSGIGWVLAFPCAKNPVKLHTFKNLGNFSAFYTWRPSSFPISLGMGGFHPKDPGPKKRQGNKASPRPGMEAVLQLARWDGWTGHWKILSWNDWKIFESDLTNKKQNMEAVLGIINPENQLFFLAIFWWYSSWICFSFFFWYPKNEMWREFLVELTTWYTSIRRWNIYHELTLLYALVHLFLEVYPMIYHDFFSKI